MFYAVVSPKCNGLLLWSVAILPWSSQRRGASPWQFLSGMLSGNSPGGTEMIILDLVILPYF